MANTARILYFAYGSNLNSKRIHINNPSATRKSIGKLKNYRLDFASYSTRWDGSVATIVPDNDNSIWGAVWELDASDIPNLDNQESVNEKLYQVVHLNIETPEKGTLNCRSYVLCNQPKKIPPGESVPDDRIPSLSYINVIITGAIESGLPLDYIEQLKSIQHNGKYGKWLPNSEFK